MKKKTMVILLAMVQGTLSVFSQTSEHDWYNQYATHLNDSNDTALRTVIEAWEKASPDSPDVSAAWFNYYCKLGMSSVMTITTQPPSPGEEYLELAKEDGGMAGYMYALRTFNDSLMQAGYAIIDKAIARYPHRLDLVFGKVHMLLQQHRYADALRQLEPVVALSVVNGNEWTWTLNESVEAGEDMFKDSMQGYFTQFAEADTISYAYQLTDMLLKYYPRDIIFRSDKAALLGAERKYDEALPLFLEIHKDAPDDPVVTYNIAYIYEHQGDKKTAVKYYKKLAKSNDPEYAGIGKQAVEELN